MRESEFKWLPEPLAVILTGKRVFIICVVITVIFVLIYNKNRSRQLLNSLPGLFTSLGLLGTFVAICSSLGDINQDSLEIDTIIRNLVPAFTSSIAGLICAFIATAVCKILYSFKYRKLEKNINLQTPEECLYNLTLLSTTTNESLTRISQQLVEQSTKNEVYNERLNTTISLQSKIL